MLRPGLMFLSSKFLNVFFLLCFSVQEVLKTLAVSLSPHDGAASPQPSKPRASPVTGTPDTLASIHLLPSRYRRRPLPLEEMEYIQVRVASCAFQVPNKQNFCAVSDFLLTTFWPVFLGYSEVDRSDKTRQDLMEPLLPKPSSIERLSSVLQPKRTHNNNEINYYVTWNVHTFYHCAECTGSPEQ